MLILDIYTEIVSIGNKNKYKGYAIMYDEEIIIDSCKNTDNEKIFIDILNLLKEKIDLNKYGKINLNIFNEIKHEKDDDFDIIIREVPPDNDYKDIYYTLHKKALEGAQKDVKISVGIVQNKKKKKKKKVIII